MENPSSNEDAKKETRVELKRWVWYGVPYLRDASQAVRVLDTVFVTQENFRRLMLRVENISKALRGLHLALLFRANK